MLPIPNPVLPLPACPCSGASMASAFPWDSGRSPSTAPGAPGAPGAPAPAAVVQECRVLKGTAATPRKPALPLHCPGHRLLVWFGLGGSLFHPLPWQCCSVTQTKGRDSTLRDVKHSLCPLVTEQQTRHSWSLIQSCFEKSCCSLSPCCIPWASAGSCLEVSRHCWRSCHLHPGISGLAHLLPRCPLGHQITVAPDSAKTPSLLWCQSTLGWGGKGLCRGVPGESLFHGMGSSVSPRNELLTLPYMFCPSSSSGEFGRCCWALEGRALSSRSWIRTWVGV